MRKIVKIMSLTAAISVAAIAYRADYRSDDAGFASLDSTNSPRIMERANNSTETDAAVADSTVASNSQAELAIVADAAWVPNTSFVGPALDARTAAAQADAASAETSAKSEKIAPRDKMSGAVAALAAAGGPGNVELVVRYDEHPELFDDEYVAELGGEVTRVYEVLDMRGITIPVASLEMLASDDNIDRLSIDDAMSSMSVSSRDASNLPSSMSSNSAYTGTNVGIAVLDTGVSSHSDLGDNVLQYSFLNGAYPVPQIVNGEIVAYNDSQRKDLYGHGTHVAGILAGSGADSNDEYKGSATGAKLLSLQVLDKNGAGSMSDVMSALDWLLQYGSYFNVRVVNLSLGKGIAESNETDPLVIAVEKLWDAGIVMIVAAGNEGFHGSMTITSPGNSRKVITVGSLTDSGTGTDFTDDYASSFSSTGPTIGDYVLKPDLLAPGNRVIASIPNGSKLKNQLPDRVLSCKGPGCNGTYMELSGTSMATPIVTSAVALMLEKDPGLSPATVKARLMRTARKIDAEPTAAGAGLLDIDAAMSDTGVIQGQALSPLMVFDEVNGGVFVEDTAVLWGNSQWASGFLYSGGFSWTEGYSATGSDGVTANGYMWTDSGIGAKGYMWTDSGIGAKGYMWTDDGLGAKSLLDGEESSGMHLNDDPSN